jgi:hypothetical protein
MTDDKLKHTPIICAFLAVILIIDLYFEVTDAYPVNPIQEQYVNMSAEERSDFLEWLLTPDMQRAIAEDWCATNQNTKRICFNAAKR